MSERPSERGAERSNEADKKQEISSLAKSPETQEDLHSKEVFSSVIGEVRPAMQADVEDMRKLVAELREREYSRSNFVSPENMLGQSTWIRGDGKTFSGERLETIENMLEVMEMRLQGMSRMEGLIKSGATLEAVKKDPFASRFLTSPEGQLMQGVVFSNKDPKTLEAEYSLAKARELKTNIIRGDEFAQGWYEKLDGTPLEKVGKEEGMSLGDKTLRKGREFANSMLGLDSLATMVAGAGLGRLAGTLISKSERFRDTALATTTVINESYAARAIPGVTFLRSKAGETIAMRLSKGAANFLGEIGKGFAYTEAARVIGGEDLAHAVSYPLMFIPGLRSEFEGSLKMSLAQSPENFRVFARWLVQKYKDPKRLEEAIATGLNEAHNRSKWNVGIDEAKQLIASMRGGLVKLFERFAPEKPMSNPVPKKSPGIQAGVAEKAGATIAEGQKPGIIEQKGVPESIDTQPNSAKVQESVKTSVSEALANDDALREMMKMGLPKDYVLALRELGIPDNQIVKMKGWNEDTIHRKEHIENYLVEFNQLAETNGTPKMTEEEAHALFGYTTNLFYRQLNGKLWKEEGQDLQITKLLKSALSKMPDAPLVQHRGDEKLLDELLKKHGIFERFFQGKEVPQEILDSLLGETITLKGFTSAGNEVTEPFWSQLDKTKYQITIRNSDAKDITKLAFFPNFGDEVKNGVKTQQESLFSSDKSIRIMGISATKKADGTPMLKIIVERNGGELAK